MAESEIFYEMLWDCPQCATTGLLGSTHRHCPTCGTAQDPSKRYFPKPGEEVEVRNHRFTGVDWTCAYCATPNARAAVHCVNCGAGQDGAKPVALVQDSAAVPPSPPPAAPPPSPAQRPWWRQWWRWALLGVLMLAALWAWMFTQKHETSATVSQRSWAREVQVEQFMPLSQSAWCDSLPNDAYDITRSREQRSTRQVADGETCHDERVDKGDGTFVKNRVCTPRYRSEPVYHLQCHYRVNRWNGVGSRKASQVDAALPFWPTAGPAATPPPGTLGSNRADPANPGALRLGAQREGARTERYELVFTSGGKRWSCTVPEAVWIRYAEGASVSLQVRMTGGADCGSLR